MKNQNGNLLGDISDNYDVSVNQFQEITIDLSGSQYQLEKEKTYTLLIVQRVGGNLSLITMDKLQNKHIDMFSIRTFTDLFYSSDWNITFTTHIEINYNITSSQENRSVPTEIKLVRLSDITTDLSNIEFREDIPKNRIIGRLVTLDSSGTINPFDKHTYEILEDDSGNDFFRIDNRNVLVLDTTFNLQEDRVFNMKIKTTNLDDVSLNSTIQTITIVFLPSVEIILTGLNTTTTNINQTIIDEWVTSTNKKGTIDISGSNIEINENLNVPEYFHFVVDNSGSTNRVNIDGSNNTVTFYKDASINYINNVTAFKGLVHLKSGCTLDVKNINMELSNNETFNLENTDCQGWLIRTFLEEGNVEIENTDVTINNIHNACKIFNFGGIVGTGAGGYNGNCTITNCSNSGEIIGIRSGGIAGQLCGIKGNCTITNCSNSVDILGSLSGGITGIGCGREGNCIITNCNNSGNILGNDNGGIVGRQSGQSGNCTITNCNNSGNISGNVNGGIAGVLSGFNGICTITNCSNSGDIIGVGSGGITGPSTGGNNGNCSITKCSNSGNISGEDNGGIAASYTAFNNGNCIITNCNNSGDISGNYNGGITGSFAGFENGICTITNCNNSGDISGEDNGGIAGQAAGYIGGECNISNCSNNGNISGNDNGGIVGSTTGFINGNVLITNSYSLINNINGNNNGGVCGNFKLYNRDETVYTNTNVNILNCFSFIKAISNEATGIGGLISKSEIENFDFITVLNSYSSQFVSNNKVNNNGKIVITNNDNGIDAFYDVEDLRGRQSNITILNRQVENLNSGNAFIRSFEFPIFKSIEDNLQVISLNESVLLQNVFIQNGTVKLVSKVNVNNLQVVRFSVDNIEREILTYGLEQGNYTISLFIYGKLEENEIYEKFTFPLNVPFNSQRFRIFGRNYNIFQHKGTPRGVSSGYSMLNGRRR
jgi:hypothetical protein